MGGSGASIIIVYYNLIYIVNNLLKKVLFLVLCVYAKHDISNLNIIPIKFNINGNNAITAKIIAIITV